MEEKRTSLRVPLDLYEKISEEAKKQKRTIHNMILVILDAYFHENS